MSYGILACGAKTEHIFKLQKRAVRIISNSGYISHTEPIFKSFNFLKVRDLYKLHVLLFYYFIIIVIIICLLILDLLSLPRYPKFIAITQETKKILLFPKLEQKWPNIVLGI